MLLDKLKEINDALLAGLLDANEHSQLRRLLLESIHSPVAPAPAAGVAAADVASTGQSPGDSLRFIPHNASMCVAIMCGGAMSCIVNYSLSNYPGRCRILCSCSPDLCM